VPLILILLQVKQAGRNTSFFLSTPLATYSSLYSRILSRQNRSA